jgi:AbrB family looped-hinge helix DNA binding protein
MPALSKITAKGQTTIPQEVRTALKSKPGDLVVSRRDGHDPS